MDLSDISVEDGQVGVPLLRAVADEFREAQRVPREEEQVARQGTQDLERHEEKRIQDGKNQDILDHLAANRAAITEVWGGSHTAPGRSPFSENHSVSISDSSAP